MCPILNVYRGSSTISLNNLRLLSIYFEIDTVNINLNLIC